MFSHNRSDERVDHDVNGVSRSSTRLSKGGSIFSRNHEDPSIVAARERVMAAEVAEREADRALLQAKTASREAKEETRRLEREAAEE